MFAKERKEEKRERERERENARRCHILRGRPGLRGSKENTTREQLNGVVFGKVFAFASPSRQTFLLL